MAVSWWNCINIAKYPWKCLNKLFWVWQGAEHAWSSYLIDRLLKMPRVQSSEYGSIMPQYALMSLNMPEHGWILLNAPEYAWKCLNKLTMLRFSIFLTIFNIKYTRIMNMLRYSYNVVIVTIVIRILVCLICICRRFATSHFMVVGKLPARKIAPSPNSNANPKPNPDPDRGGEQFSSGEIFRTPHFIYIYF